MKNVPIKGCRMVGLQTDIGNCRELNEDFLDYYEDNSKSIFIIADGMGGYNAGEVASKLAVDSTLNYLKELEIDLNNNGETLKKAIEYSNKLIYDKSKGDAECSGMGTTITASLVIKGTMVVANVGDSSCYIIKKSGISKVTKDHSLVQELVDNGSITEEEAINHPKKNVITRALGTSNLINIDIFTVDLSDVIKVILCTDGLTNYLSLDEMHNILCANDNMTACRNLIELSKEKGGKDNISVIVFEGEDII